MKNSDLSNKLTNEQRKKAISAVRQRRSKSTRRDVSSSKQAFKKADFSTLPGFAEMQLQKSFADYFKIENPFFRQHDARAGGSTIIEGVERINFASYDYLGLNGHSEVMNAAKEAIDQYGISASASRVVGGERPVHGLLEKKIADIYNVEDAVVFVSGHATNVSTIGQIMTPDDLVIHDAFIHNSILSGIKLSGAKRKSFPHNDLDGLQRLLASQSNKPGQTLVVVEGIYSMDGDYPDLPQLLELKRKYDFWLMVDEAHSLGVMGAAGKGIADHFGIDPSDVDIWMGTFSKSLAGCGGYIAGSHDLIDYIKSTASGFVYSVGMPPLIASSTIKAIDVMHSEPERVKRLQENGKYFLSKAQEAGFDTGSSEGFAIVPIIFGDSIKTIAVSSKLLEKNINVLPIIYPVIPEGSARLRFFITAGHDKSQIDETISQIVNVVKEHEENPIYELSRAS